MALPTSTGIWRYPFKNSPGRTWYQAQKDGSTTGTIVLLPTISTTDAFVMTHFFYQIFETVAAGTPSLILKDQTVLSYYAKSMSGQFMNLYPNGIKSPAAVDTHTAWVTHGGIAIQASYYILGYMDG